MVKKLNAEESLSLIKDLITKRPQLLEPVIEFIEHFDEGDDFLQSDHEKGNEDESDESDEVLEQEKFEKPPVVKKKKIKKKKVDEVKSDDGKYEELAREYGVDITFADSYGKRVEKGK